MYASGNGNYTITGASGIETNAAAGTLAGSAAATGKLTLGAKSADNASSVTPAAYTGTLTLANATNNFTAGIDIETGALVGNAQNLVAPSITNKGALIFNQTTSGTYTTPIIGNGLIVMGASSSQITLTLAADYSTITGTTNVAAGTLLLGTPANPAALGSPVVNVTAGATFGGAGAVAGNVTAAAGGGIAATGTLAIAGALTLGNATTITIDNANDALLQAATLTRAGTSTFNLTIADSGTYLLLDITTGLAATATNNLLATINGDPFGGRSAAQFFADANNLYVTIITANAAAVIWSGTSGSTWANNYVNWTVGGDSDAFVNGDGAIFDDTAATLAGASTVDVAANGVSAVDMTVNNSAGNDYTFTGGSILTSNTLTSNVAAAAQGKLIKTGAGALNFANAANNFTNGIEISGGVIGFTDAAQLGDGGAGGNGIHFSADAAIRANANATLANNLNVDPNITATLDSAGNTLTYTGTLQLNTTGTLAKIGAGILSIASDNSANTGAILVSQGALSVDGPTGNLGGAIDIAPAAILAGSGNVSGTVNAEPGAHIYPGATSAATAPATLTINTLNLDTSVLSFNLYADDASDRLNATTINLGPNASTIDIASFQVGTFDLGNLASLSTLEVTINGFAQSAGARQTGVITPDATNTDLILKTTADISRVLVWTGATGTTWTPNDANWTDKSAVDLYAAGDQVVFDGLADSANPASRTISLDGPGVKVSDMTVTGPADYTFTGAAGITADPVSVMSGSIITTGTGALLKAGSGTLAFENGANNFLGGITLAAGAITFTDAAQLGTGTNAVTFTADAALANTATTDQTLSNAITLAPGVTGTLDTGATTLTLTGALSTAGDTSDASDASSPLPTAALASAAWSGSSPIQNPKSKIENPTTLAKIGSGTLALSGNTPITAGGDADADAPDLTIALTQGAVSLNNTAFTGTIAAAPNTTVQSVADTTNATSLILAGSSTLAGAGSIAGMIAVNGAVATDIASGNVLALTGTVAGAGGFTLNNTGELQLVGAAAVGTTGTTQLNAGTLRITGVSGTTPGSRLVIPSSTFTFNGTEIEVPENTFTYSGATFTIPGFTDASITTDPNNASLVYYVTPSNTFFLSGTTVVVASSTVLLTDATGNLVTGGVIPSSTTNVTYGVSNAAASTQNILLNGGTLTFSTGAGANNLSDLTANDWRGVALTQGAAAASSVVNGSNDLIYVGSGTQQFAIQAGISVAVNAGNGVTVLGNTANNFTGVVRVDSGTLQITDLKQIGAIGSNNSTKLALNGGAIEFSASGSIGRNIDLRSATNTVIVDDGQFVSIDRIMRTNSGATATPDGATFIKAGSGTLQNTANMQATGMLVDAGRYIALGNNGVSSGTITVNAAAAFQMSGPATASTSTLGLVAGAPFIPSSNGASVAPAFQGSGTLDITSSQIALASPNTTIAHINISGAATALAINIGYPNASFAPNSTITVDGATLVLATDHLATGAITLANSATLAFLMNAAVVSGSYVPSGLPLRTATLASLNATGAAGGPATLLFNTNLALGYANHLTVNSPVSGAYTIGITNTGDLPARLTAPVELISAPQGLAPGATFTAANPVFDSGLYQYNVTTVASGNAVSILVTGTGGMSNAAGAVNAMAAMMPMSWFSELDSVTQRLGELHSATRDGKCALAAWMRGSGEQFNFNTKVNGTPFMEHQFSAEAGIDCQISDNDAKNAYAGAYFGYGQASRNHAAAGDATSDSAFGGVYLTVNTKNGWYADAVAKFNTFRNNFTALAPSGERDSANYRNWAMGGSLELGKNCALKYDWYLQPMLQVAFTTISGASYATDTGMNVSLLTGDTFQARAGFLFGRPVTTTRHGTLNAYVKACYADQWTTGGKLDVSTAGGQRAHYAPVIEGASVTGGAGLSWLFTKNTQLYFDYETTQARAYIKPWGLNLALRHMW